jgi:hypothetical protein
MRDLSHRAFCRRICDAARPRAIDHGNVDRTDSVPRPASKFLAVDQACSPRAAGQQDELVLIICVSLYSRFSTAWTARGAFIFGVISGSTSDLQRIMYKRNASSTAKTSLSFSVSL